MWATAVMVATAISTGAYMSKFNWRTVDNNRITTKYEEIWLWDSELAVAIPWKTEGKQMRNVNPAFTLWMPKTGEDDPKPPVTFITEAQADARSNAIINSHDDDCPF